MVCRPRSPDIRTRVRQALEDADGQTLMRADAPTKAIQQSPAVKLTAALTALNLAFSGSGGGDAVAGAVGAVGLTFQCDLDVAAADTVSVLLPEFSRQGGSASSLSLTDPDSNFDGAQSTWTESTETLTLLAAQPLAAGAPVTVTVASGSGIKLPSSGLRLDQPAMAVSLEGAVVTAGATVVASSNAVKTEGTFQQLELQGGGALHYTPATVGALTDLSIRFQYSEPLEGGDAVTFTLGAFGGDNVLPPDLTLSGSCWWWRRG